MKAYLLALDEGTTSARAILFDRAGRIVSEGSREFPQYYPRPGWVEQDPMELYAAQWSAVAECVAKSGISPAEIAAAGITNQRETTLLWEKKTGRPLGRAIVWQCRRTQTLCEQLIREGWQEHIAAVTGLRADPYFSGTKLSWLLDTYDPDRKRAFSGELLFGTVDTWLLWKLTEGRVHATDRTNASRTMLFNIHTGEWDKALLERLNIPECILPEVKCSAEKYGSFRWGAAEIPILGVAGDQQASLFGQGCFQPGEAKNTYGTGCFLLEHTGHEAPVSRHGLLTTVAAGEKGREMEYALEGSVFWGGSVIRWLRDGLGLLREAKDSEYFARKVPDTGGVYIVPAFSGLGAPHWKPQARGLITGLTGGSRSEHIIRAGLESIAYQTNDILTAMEADSGKKITRLKTDGGASANDFLMQFQADISRTCVTRSAQTESTAAGAAFLAGLTAGFFSSREEVKALCGGGKEFLPEMEEDKSRLLRDGWRAALAQTVFPGKQT